MEKKYILNVGLNDKDTKIQKIDSIEAYKIVENTLIIEILFASDDIINKIIKILKQVLNQESILKQVQEITISFE